MTVQPRPPYEDMLEALRRLALTYVEYTDPDDDDIDSYEISRAVRDTLTSLEIIETCEDCDGGFKIVGFDCSREHRCPECGYSDCECPEDEEDDEEGGLG